MVVWTFNRVPLLYCHCSLDLDSRRVNMAFKNRRLSFNRVMVIVLFLAVCIPLIALFIVDLPHDLRDKWAPWAMALYSLGLLQFIRLWGKP